MLSKMGLHVIMNRPGKPCKIQLSENHELVVANLILLNNLYFLDIVEDAPPMQANAAGKKSNCRQK